MLLYFIEIKKNYNNFFFLCSLNIFDLYLKIITDRKNPLLRYIQRSFKIKYLLRENLTLCCSLDSYTGEIGEYRVRKCFKILFIFTILYLKIHRSDFDDHMHTNTQINNFFFIFFSSYIFILNLCIHIRHNIIMFHVHI